MTASHVLWKEKSSIPEVPSPIGFQNPVYMVRNGGIVTCLDATTGKLVYRARLGAPGAYYSSPIETGDRLIAASAEGTVVIFGTGDALDVLARNDFGEPIFATPPRRTACCTFALQQRFLRLRSDERRVRLQGGPNEAG